MKKIYLFLLLLCCFGTLYAQVPVVGSFSPVKGPIGTVVTITGSNFNATPANNVVYFGTNRAVVSTASATQLTVIAPAAGANNPISVLNSSTALTGYSQAPFINTFPSKGSITTADFDTHVEIGNTVDPKIKAPQTVYFADLDGDGAQDMIICNSGTLNTAAPYTYSLSIMLNNFVKGAALTASSFGTKINLPTSSNSTGGIGPFCVAVGDLDGDGKPDLVVCNYAAGSLSIFRNTSTGTGSVSFAQVGGDITTLAGPKVLVIADYDKDGKPDIAVTCASASKVCVYPNKTASGGTVTLGTRVDVTTPAGNVNMTQGDLDGDGKVDLATANATANTISAIRNTSVPGTISFDAAISYNFALTGVFPLTPYGIAIGDLDGDGKPEIVASSYNAVGATGTVGNNVIVYRNTSSTGSAFTAGSFAATTFPSTNNSYGITLADMDGDGKLDILTANLVTNTIGLFHNITAAVGSISFDPTILITNGGSESQIFACDIDGDGKPDMAAANVGQTSVSLIRNGPTPFVNVSSNSSTYSTAFTAAGAPVVIDNGLTIYSRTKTTLASATVVIKDNFTSTEDVLGFTAVTATMGNIAGTYDSNTGILTLNSAGGTATVAQWQTALQSVTYANTNRAPANYSRVITFAVNDGTTAGASSPKGLSINYKSNIGVTNIVLSAGTLTPVFAGGVKTYTANVPNASGTITVTTTLSDALGALTINGSSAASGAASAVVPLAVGPNNIAVIVTAQDGVTTGTYNITVTRAPSADANLSNLVLSTGTLSPAFTSATNTYTASVSNAAVSVTLTPTSYDGTASKITVNGTPVADASPSAAIPLVVGNNVITTIVTAQDGITTNTYTITVNRASSANANLLNLTMTHGYLSPTFAGGSNTYNDNVTSTLSSVSFVAVLADVNAVVTINGVQTANNTLSAPVNLTGTTTVIPITVTAQDGNTTNTYTVNVKKVVLSTNANLTALSLSSGTLSPVFDGNTTAYTASVANSTTTITASPTSAAAVKITVNGNTTASGSASPGIPLTVGNNLVNITVTAPDSVTTKSYAVMVNRAASANADLSALAVSSSVLSPAFSSANTAYTATVSSQVSSVTVTASLADNTASVTVNGQNVTSGGTSAPISLSPGLNVLTVKVTSQNGTIKTYTVNVTQILLSTNANLSALTISAGAFAPAFSSAVNNYTQSVPNAVSALTVTPAAAFANATIAVNGVNVASGSPSTAIPLNVGLNTINVVVTAEDHIATKTYILSITRLQLTQTITFAAANTVTYGTADYTPVATSDNNTVPVTYTSSNNAVAAIIAGKIHITGAGTAIITASQAGNAVYSAAIPVTQTLTVNTAILAVKANDQTKTYGSVNPVLTAAYTGFVNGDDATALTTQPTLSTVASPTSPVGSYAITASGAASNNYTFTYTPGNLTVTPAALKIAANNQTKAYGDVNPALTLIYTGFVNGDDATRLTTQPAVTTTAVTTSPVTAANYPITVSGAASPNYSISYTPGTLAIIPAPLTITANNLTKVYLAANPTLTVAYTGFKGIDNETTLLTPPTLATTAVTASPAGTYPISVAGAVANANYTLTMNNGTLTVVSYARVLTFNPLNTVTYGTPDFVLTATVNTPDVITYTSSTPAIATIINGNILHIVGAGSVSITASVPANSSYTGAVSVTQMLTITKAAQTINFANIPGPLLIKQVRTLNAVSSAGAAYPVTFTSADSHIASVYNNGAVTPWSVFPISAGTVVITATQAGDNNYLPATATQTITVLPDDVVISAALSPNGDGVNDRFLINGIENFPNNRLTIFNRSGVKIYEKERYDNINNLFDGHASTGAMMQQGSYFYILEYGTNTQGKSNRKTGYIILKY